MRRSFTNVGLAFMEKERNKSTVVRTPMAIAEDALKEIIFKENDGATICTLVTIAKDALSAIETIRNNVKNEHILFYFKYLNGKANEMPTTLRNKLISFEEYFNRNGFLTIPQQEELKRIWERF
jgi:hypothetical protein